MPCPIKSVSPNEGIIVSLYVQKYISEYNNEHPENLALQQEI